MLKMIVWDDGYQVHTATPEWCIESQKKVAAERGYVYENDEEALKDFKAVHWAMERDFSA